jgi:hypothetical protein
MRGDDAGQPGVFSYISAEERVPKDHPLRPVREMVDAALKEMSPLFESLYSRFETGRHFVEVETEGDDLLRNRAA